MNARDDAGEGVQVSPAAQHIIDGALFDLDGDQYMIDDHFACGGDPARDVVVVRGVEYMLSEQHEVRRAVQVRDIETWIEQDRVGFASGPPALDVNISAGWSAARREIEDISDLVVSDHLGRRVTRPAAGWLD